MEFIHRSAFFAYQYENCAVAVKMLPLHLEDSRREEFMYEMAIMKEVGEIVSSIYSLYSGQNMRFTARLSPEFGVAARLHYRMLATLHGAGVC